MPKAIGEGQVFARPLRRSIREWRAAVRVITWAGRIRGGVITYDTDQGQMVAVFAGMTSPVWPTQKVTGRVVVGIK
ncbi:MAG TPA: hypothetical protein VHU23_03200 [Rhizomicrobium sp.]|jgi:hypothetical protein|nr:hypothetical protein [Rhizomicrobium sp.]